MDKSKKIKINDEKDLYNILPEEFRKEFALGMHEFYDGANYLGRPKNLQGKWSKKTVEEVKASILKEGLRFPKDSYLLSTVTFNENSFDGYLFNEWPKLGGVIVALPKVMRSETGKEIFVGSPNEHSKYKKHWARREQATSLSDLILPDKGLLNPMFIIGTYSKIKDGIEVTTNPNHIVFNEGKVPDEFFEERYNRLINDEIEEMEDAVIGETISQQQNYEGKLNPTFDLIKQQVEEAEEWKNSMQEKLSKAKANEEDIEEIKDEVDYLRNIGLAEVADDIQEIFKGVMIIDKLNKPITKTREEEIER